VERAARKCAGSVQLKLVPQEELEMNRLAMTAAIVTAALTGGPVLGGYTITQGSSATPYTDHVLNFDEVGGPTGVVSADAWLGSHGIAELQAGDLVPQVDNYDATLGGGGGWLGGNTNAFFGNFGVFMMLDHDATEMSMQIWDPSGPPSFFGGGLNVFLFNDGVQVHDLFVQNGDIATPAWGGIGDSWFDITTSGGDVFDEVRILGFGFGPTTVMDDLSWNQVPAPGALALFGLAGLGARRRRR
jgi:hypothetical protein